MQMEGTLESSTPVPVPLSGITEILDYAASVIDYRVEPLRENARRFVHCTIRGPLSLAPLSISKPILVNPGPTTQFKSQSETVDRQGAR